MTDLQYAYAYATNRSRSHSKPHHSPFSSDFIIAADYISGAFPSLTNLMGGRGVVFFYCCFVLREEEM